MKRLVSIILFIIAVSVNAVCQELQAKVTINHNQIQGTDASVFENLQQTLEQFINDRQWTNYQFQKNEKIVCNFNITVTKYDQSSNLFTCNALIQANRPVYNASYTTTLYNNKDNDFYCREVYLGKGQTAENWHEITAEEAKAIDEAREAKRLSEEKARKSAE